MTTRRRLLLLAAIAAAVGAVAAAAAVTPVPGDPNHLTLFGQPYGTVCPFLATTGLPCPSCGMTRSWVWAVRGEVGLALRYNVAGATLLLGVVANGLIRAWLLAGGTLPKRAWIGAVVGAIAWMLMWIGGWAVRLGGGYPMP